MRLRTGFFALPIWCAERTLLALTNSACHQLDGAISSCIMANFKKEAKFLLLLPLLLVLIALIASVVVPHFLKRRASFPNTPPHLQRGNRAMNRVCRVRLRTGFFALPIWCAERTLLALTHPHPDPRPHAGEGT